MPYTVAAQPPGFVFFIVQYQSFIKYIEIGVQSQTLGANCHRQQGRMNYIGMQAGAKTGDETCRQRDKQMTAKMTVLTFSAEKWHFKTGEMTICGLERTGESIQLAGSIPARIDQLHNLDHPLCADCLEALDASRRSPYTTWMERS
jgi:hypothetical protein